MRVQIVAHILPNAFHQHPIRKSVLLDKEAEIGIRHKEVWNFLSL